MIRCFPGTRDNLPSERSANAYERGGGETAGEERFARRVVDNVGGDCTILRPEDDSDARFAIGIDCLGVNQVTVGGAAYVRKHQFAIPGQVQRLRLPEDLRHAFQMRRWISIRLCCTLGGLQC